MEAWLSRLIDFTKSFTIGSQKLNPQPTTVQVSVCLVNGQEVFLDHEFHVQDHVITIQEKVESLLKPSKCQLLQEGNVLIESQRIGDAGILDGSTIVAIILEEDQQIFGDTAASQKTE